VLLNLKKKKKSIKIDPGTQNKTWYVKWNKTITAYNTSFCAIWCVMEDWKAILTGLGQYCFSVLHNTFLYMISHSMKCNNCIIFRLPQLKQEIIMGLKNFKYFDSTRFTEAHEVQC
jgi:hypothetical protein